jgi:hypothetical protein
MTANLAAVTAWIPGLGAIFIVLVIAMVAVGMKAMRKRR